jgi:hypothetical protein
MTLYCRRGSHGLIRDAKHFEFAYQVTENDCAVAAQNHPFVKIEVSSLNRILMVPRKRPVYLCCVADNPLPHHE